MEQLTNFFSHVIKFRFWYISGISIIALLANWYMFNSSLDSARAAATTKLEGKLQAIKGVIELSTPIEEADEPLKVHPNAATQKGMAEEIAKATNSVIGAWKLRRQAQMDILVWPRKIIGSEKFITEFSRYEPPEKFNDIPDNSEFRGYCLVYFQHIQERMPEICDLIRAKWDHEVKTEGTDAAQPASQGEAERPEGDGQSGAGTDPTGAAGAGADGSGEPPTTTGDAPATPTDEPGPKLAKPVTVQWNKGNQDLWYSKLTRFKGLDGCKTTFPTGYQVLALQQDLWLLEAMFKVVAEVNGDTLANDLAKIKQIHHVVFGREARAQLGTVMVPDARLSGVRAPAVADDMSGMAVPGRGDEGGGFNMSVPIEMEKLLPFHGRYVDANFKPIEIPKLYGVLTSPTPPAEDLELIVAKRVPFRIAMKMSESAIPEFIAACGNSPFEFEIAQMRINRHEPNGGIAFRGVPSGSQVGRGDSPFGNSTSGGSDLNSSLPKDAPVIETRINDNVAVEFYGIVRIYNPVDEEQVKAVAGLVGGEGT